MIYNPKTMIKTVTTKTIPITKAALGNILQREKMIPEGDLKYLDIYIEIPGGGHLSGTLVLNNTENFLYVKCETEKIENV